MPAGALALLLASVAVAQSEWRFTDVDRTVAVADIHGAYGAFERILGRAGLIDEAGAWVGEEAHLVIVGDVVDRGPDSRRALDLIRRLETEALAAGGQVHLVLGNHEIMNLTGDMRYVSAGEYAAFAGEEPADVRAEAFDRYLQSPAGNAGAEDERAAFEAEYPPGFFAHREAFSTTGEYGAWLIDKPALVVIDDVAFVHGGLAAGAASSAETFNDRLRAELVDYMHDYEAVVDAGLVPPTASVYDVPSLAGQLLEGAQDDASVVPGSLEDELERLAELGALTILSPDGPYWYRGNVGCNRLTEQDRLAEALEGFGAERLVIGHTPTPGALVLSRMGESVLRIDTGMLNDYYGGRAAALVIEDGALSVFYEDEDVPSRPTEQPRRVGYRPDGMSARMLETVLRNAELVSRQSFDASAALVSLTDGERELLGLFTSADREGVNPAVAAYRLDRLLGLDMVPVTVEREIDGIRGALQFWPANAIDEAARSAQQLGASAWCPLGDQFDDMYLFDALIFNRGRTVERIRYSTDNFELLLVGNDLSFTTDRERPVHLSELPVEPTPAWRDALASLDEETVTAQLGDVLDRRRIRALLARRDHLLDIAR